MSVRATTSLLAVLALAACATPEPPPPKVTAAPMVDLSTVSASAQSSPLAAVLPAALRAHAAAPSEAAALAAFYRARAFAPMWFDGGAFTGWRERAAPLLLGATSPPVHDDGSASVRAVQEIALSAAVLQVGTSGASTGDAGLDRLVAGFVAAVEAAAPAEPGLYAGQGEAITRYRAIVAAGGWPALPNGPALEPGDAAAALDILRRRLEIEGDLEPGASSGPTYDPVLVAAVERFQARHGLEVDGVVGPATRRALNVPAATRLAQLERSHARRAALALELGDRFVLVNIPAFELRYVRGGEVRHRARVVVGTPRHQTPVFSDTIEHLVFNPYWHVPASIAREELVHDFKKDAGAMAARGFQLIDSGGGVASPTTVDWASVSPAALPFRFRQGPGAANALGHVKFMFPNEHSVYLHDTPSRHLFARSARAFSHGCVRVEGPMTLAERLLETDGYSAEEVAAWVAARRTRTVHLRVPVPVHLVYLTAWTDDAGRVQFREDLYRRDV